MDSIPIGRKGTPETDERVRAAWKAAADQAKEDPNRSTVLFIGSGNPNQKALSPFFLEKKMAHMNALDADQEAQGMLDRLEHETGREPLVVEVRVPITTKEALDQYNRAKTFEVTLQPPKLEDKKDK